MNKEQYDEFTDDLAENLRQCAEVIGLVAVGSMAKQDYQPDRWSDHDFFVIVRTGYQESFRRNLSWLPGYDKIMMAYRETEHGLKVLYNDGHLIEFAIFDLNEIYLAKINRYRILIGGEEIMHHLREIQKTTSERSKLIQDNAIIIDQLVMNLLIGLGRYHRGEKASAHRFVKIHGLENLMTLIEKNIASARGFLIDNLDPLRRFEFIYPELGEELDSALLAPIPHAIAQMVGILQRALSPCLEARHKMALGALERSLFVDGSGIDPVIPS